MTARIVTSYTRPGYPVDGDIFTILQANTLPGQLWERLAERSAS